MSGQCLVKLLFPISRINFRVCVTKLQSGHIEKNKYFKVTLYYIEHLKRYYVCTRYNMFAHFDSFVNKRLQK